MRACLALLLVGCATASSNVTRYELPQKLYGPHEVSIPFDAPHRDELIAALERRAVKVNDAAEDPEVRLSVNGRCAEAAGVSVSIVANRKQALVVPTATPCPAATFDAVADALARAFTAGDAKVAGALALSAPLEGERIVGVTSELERAQLVAKLEARGVAVAKVTADLGRVRYTLALQKCSPAEGYLAWMQDVQSRVVLPATPLITGSRRDGTCEAFIDELARVIDEGFTTHR